MRIPRQLTATVLLYTFGLQTAAFAQYPVAPLPGPRALPPVLLQAAVAAPGASTRAHEDLRRWSPAGAAGEGDWQVAPDGLFAVQKAGGKRPTLLVSPEDVAGATLRARVRVLPSTHQDDFIGLAFGVRSPLALVERATYDLWLVDWKARAEDASGHHAMEGFTLSRIQGAPSSTLSTFWEHAEGTDAHVVARRQGSGFGWQKDREYTLELSVRPGRVRFSVDGRTVFDVSGTFGPGHFGLFAYSQPEVRFHDVSITTGNAAPVANAGTDRFVAANGSCRASLTLDGSASSDPDGDTLTYQWTGPFGSVEGATPSVVLPSGINAIELTVSDGQQTSTDTVAVTVEDRTPPTLACPAPVHVTPPAGQCRVRGVTLGTPVASDNCGAAKVTNDAPAAFPLGTTTVTWSALDAAGLRSSCPQTVVIEDLTKPVVEASVQITTLWPPSHKLVDVGLVACARDECRGRIASTVTVYSDEPIDSTGDGHTAPDAVIQDGKLLLRPERSGNRDGRVYLLIVGADDAGGHTAHQCLAVTVPKSQSKKDLDSVAAQAQAALEYCNTSGQPPAGYVLAGQGTPSCPSKNAPPEVDAGPDQTIELPTASVALDGAVTDDGLPLGGTLISQWTKVTGPGDVSFTDPTRPQTTATFSLAGEYVLRLAATDGELADDDEMTVTVIAENAPPTVDAGPDQTINWPTAAVSLDGTASDDGLPPGSALSTTWTKVSGPGTVAFGDAAAADTTAAFSAPGVYVLQLAASDTRATVMDTMTVVVNECPVVNAGPDVIVDLAQGGVDLAAVVTDDGLPPGSTLSVRWSPTSGPAPVSFADPALAATRVTFTAVGTYVLRLTASDGACTSADELTVTVVLNRPPTVDAGPDQAVDWPVDGTALDGAAADDGLPPGSTLATLWSKVSGPGEVTFADPSAPDTTVTFGSDGDYVLRLTASDGVFTSTDDVTIAVHPTLSIDDASIVEGHRGSNDVVLTVHLSAASIAPVSTDYGTASAEATEQCDYLFSGGTLTFAPGVTTQTVAVSILGELAVESDETLRVGLVNPSGARLKDGEAVVTIVNDDTPNRAPVFGAEASPADGAGGQPENVTLAWSAADPDGDAVTHDVYFGTTFDTTGQSFRRICASGGAGARSGAASAYDDAGDRLFLFGGRSAAGDQNDVHVLAGASGTQGVPTWTTLNAAGGPSPRRGASAVYDPVGQRLIVHGGCSGDCSSALADTWALDLTAAAPAWSALPDAASARSFHAAAYDAAHDRLIVVGGRHGNADVSDVAVLRDTRAPAASWDTLAPAGTGPTPRSGMGSAYDAASDRLFLFGGRTAADTVSREVWILSRASGIGGAPVWTLAPTTGGPVARWGQSVVYDAPSDRLLIFGGSGAGYEGNTNVVVGDLWMLIGAGGPAPQWLRIVPAGAVPSGRLLAAAAYSSARNRLVIALGENNRAGSRFFDDVWVLEGAVGSLPLVAADHPAPTFDVQAPSVSAEYFWKVVARDARGAESGSPVRRFRRNAPPVVDAGADQTVVSLIPAALAGSATDDGLPRGVLTHMWSVVSGPGQVTFGDANALATSVVFSAAGTYVLRLTADDTLATASDDVTITVTPRPAAGRSYTNDIDFDEGTRINTQSQQGDLKLAGKAEAFNYMWVAVSSKGTIVRIDTRTGKVAGEYKSSPDGQPRNPSRTTVDLNGAVWATNRDGNSVLHIATPESGLCVDRNGNGRIDTSTGFGDLRSWTNTGGADTNGGVNTAQDECIIHYVRVSSSGTRHVSVTKDNDIWVSGTGGSAFDLIDGQTGAIKRREPSVGYGGYGGLIDGNGVIWSARSLLRWDTRFSLTGPNGGNWKGYNHDSYGLCIDSKGFVWETALGGNVLRKWSPDGVLVGTFQHGNYWAQGCAVDKNDHVWVAHSLFGPATVGHVKNDGTWIGNAGVDGNPTGVAVDSAGKIWSTNYNTGTVSRIDPNAGPIGKDGQTRVGARDLTTIYLGGNPYNYSDMTGSSLTGAPGRGTWSVVFDSGIASAEWAPLLWKASLFGDGAIFIRIATSADGVTYSAPILVESGQPHAAPNGRYIRIDLEMKRSTSGETPLLHEISVGTVGYGFPPPPVVVPPDVDAGPDRTVIAGQLAPLAGSATGSDNLALAWTQTSGPGTVVFSDPASHVTPAKARKSGSFIAAEDFSTSRNPHGPWSYGHTTTSGQFTRLVRSTFQAIETWVRQPSSDSAIWMPAVGKSMTGRTVVDNDIVFPHDAIWMHPGPTAGQRAIVRWTAPQAGRYRVEGLFQGASTSTNYSTDVAVRLGNTSLFTQNIAGRFAAAPFALTDVDIAAGQTIDFSVGFGANNNYNNDSTSLSASITPVAALGPEGTYTLQLAGNDGLNEDRDEMSLSVLPAQPVPSAACVSGWWPGDGTATDLITNTAAQLVNGATFGPGKVGPAFVLDGVNDYVRVAPAPPNAGGSFTLEGWVKPTTADNQRPVFEFNSGSTFGVHLWLNLNAAVQVAPGALYANVVNSTTSANGIVATTAGLVKPHVWTHVALTYDRSTGIARLYVNGQRETEANLGSYLPRISFPFLIGARPNTNNFFAGGIDEAALYECPLGPEEVAALYQAGAAGKFKEINKPPVVDAGTKQMLMPPTLSTALAGSVGDDGLPRGGAVSSAWTKVSGPGTVSFADAGFPGTTVTFGEQGDYVLRLTATDTQHTASDDVLVRVWPTNAAPVVDAGAIQNVAFPPGTATLAGEVEDDDLPLGATVGFLWSKLSGPGDVTFTDATKLDTEATFSAAGTYVLKLEANDTELSASDTVTIVVNTAPLVNAGPDAVVQVNDPLALAGSATDDDLPPPPTLTFAWSVVSCPGEVTFADPTSSATAATFSQPGSCLLRLTTTDGHLEDTDELAVLVYPTNQPPSVAAGADQTIGLPPGTAVLQGAVTDDDNLPPGRTVSVEWSAVACPGTVTFADKNALQTTVTFSQDGPCTLRLTATDGKGTSSDEVVVLVERVNAAPEVKAGADQIREWPDASVTLQGSVDDDGLPPNATLSASWSLVSSSTGGTVTFANAASPATGATFSAIGDYVLRLTATDGTLSASDDATVRIVAANVAPVVDAGPAQSVALPPGTGTLAGSATDDGLPVGNAVTYLWTQVSGPAPVAFANAGSPTSGVTFTQEGVYVLRLTASDGVLAGQDEVTVTVEPPNAAPVVSAGADQTVQLPAIVTLNGSVTDDGRPTGGTLTIQWSQVSGPGRAAFSAPTSAVTNVTFDVTGIYVLRLTGSDSKETTRDDVRVQIDPSDPPSELPTVAFTAPAPLAGVTAPTEVRGTATSPSLLSWRLDFRGDGEIEWRPLATGATPVVDGPLGVLDPTLLLNGLYTLRLSAFDTANRGVQVTRDVVVKDNFKVGHFSVSFVDLQVPVSGIPMTITRTYDSRDKRKGDFGFGWRLDVANVKVSENGSLGLGWTGSNQPGYFPTYCLQANPAKIVTVTLPDGRTWEYEAVVTKSCQFAVPIQEVQVSYRPRPGTTTLGQLVPLRPDGTPITHALVVGSWPDDWRYTTSLDLYDGETWDLVDPDHYKLVMPDGVELFLDQSKGVTKIRDLNGNALTINPGGITDSFGNGVVFKRDAQGRIESITDPNNATMTYTYDAAGDLVAYKDRTSATTRFEYLTRVPHHLEKIVDPLGRPVIRNLYDDSGRLIGHVDAEGKTIEYGHQIGARREELKDRLGNTRILEYDTRGNVVKEIDPKGKQVLRTFDARNNRTSETLPHDPSLSNAPKSTFVYDTQDNLLSEIDPENHTTEYTYNSRKQVLTKKDPRGIYTIHTYDAKGHLISTKTADSLAGPPITETTNAYDASGNLESQTQVVDGVALATTYKYDTKGQLKEEKDAAGLVTTYTHDAAGNRRTETTSRTKFDCVTNGVSPTRNLVCTPGTIETLTTEYEYDGNGRLRKTIDPDGTFTETVYNPVGRPKETYDKLRRKTTYEYDVKAGYSQYGLFGLMDRTTYADGTTEETLYNAERHRIASKDRAGRITRYEYDGRGRVTKTIPPGLYGAEPVTLTAYDAAGRISSTTDARGKTTFFEYDNAGRHTKVRAPHGNGLFAISSFGYDVNGNQRTFTDPNGNTVEYSYDALNRRTRTDFPAVQTDQGPVATFTEIAYDEQGRRRSETDQAGKATQFRYDAMGRLVKVIDAALRQTTYQYDEVGNRITQTDANGRTTAFEYDKLGRQTARILPDGSRETMAYDEVGNMKSKTDFMGRAITYEYDSNNRLTKKSVPSTGDVTFTYTPTGRRKTMTDARGETAYEYDERDRLTRITQPGAGAIAFTYDANGNRLAMTVTAAGVTRTTNYDYDDGSRLDHVIDPDAGTVDFDYDANGNRKALAYPNQTRTDYDYNALNRLTNLATTGPAGPIQSYAFILGRAGNRRQITEHDGTVRAFDYDDLYRLTSENITIASATLYNKTFVYDFVGNRKQQATAGLAAAVVNYTHDERDRLTNEGGQAYAWDDNGNLTQKTGEADYTWDTENRLIQVVKGGAVTEHAYDADGNRVRTKVTPSTGPPTTTHYLVDTSGSLSHVVAEIDDGGALVARYIRGGDDLLNVVRPNDSGVSVRWYHADGLGSIRVLSNEEGAITDRYGYTAFGEPIASQRIGTDPQPYAFAGEPYDANVGFAYHRARWLDPRVGGFASMDLFAGQEFEPFSLHRYLYANATPTNATDPTGQFTLGGMMIAGAIIGALAGMTAYTMTHRAEEFTWTGFGAWALGGALIGAMVGAGVYYGPWVSIRWLGMRGSPGNWQAAEGFIARILGMTKNTQTFMMGGRARIPDFIDLGRRFLFEVKWVQRLSATAQLRDYAAFCIANGLRMYIFVRASTQVSAPLAQLVQSTGGSIIRIFVP